MFPDLPRHTYTRTSRGLGAAPAMAVNPMLASGSGVPLDNDGCYVEGVSDARGADGGARRHRLCDGAASGPDSYSASSRMEDDVWEEAAS